MLHQTTNLGVRSSNLFGRAKSCRKISALRQAPVRAPTWSAHVAALIGGRSATNRRFPGPAALH